MGARTVDIESARAELRGTGRAGVSVVSVSIALLSLFLALGSFAAIAAHLPAAEILLLLAAVVATASFVLRRAIAQSASVPPHKNLLDSAGLPVVAIGADGRVLYVNPAAERLLGYREADLMAAWHTPEILAHGEAARLVAEMEKACGIETASSSVSANPMAAYLDCVRALRPNLTPSFEAQLRRKDGRPVRVRLHISPLRDAAGLFGGLVAVAVEQKPVLKKEPETREPRQRLGVDEPAGQQQFLLDSVADGICSVDRESRVTFANPAAARLLCMTQSQIAGAQLHDVLHGAAPPSRGCGDECAIRRAAEKRRASAGEDVVYRADGTFFPAEYVLTPVMDEGLFSGFVLSFRDISQRSALDRLKDEFISTVSHELRTPLTSIRGALGLLSSGMLGQVNEKAANLLRIALTNSDRLVRLINEILDLERIQSGREPLDFRPVQLAEIVSQTIEGMQPVADAGGVHLIHDAVQAEVAADPDRLLQVLTNLLSNAIKFSPPNSTVSVMLRPGATGVTLSVIDHGRGIPADKLEAIFDRFQQVDASDSRQKGGTGLGLAICKTIVQQHSGRIWAERNPVRGSTFRVFLPYQPESLDAQIGGPARAEVEDPVHNG